MSTLRLAALLAAICWMQAAAAAQVPRIPLRAGLAIITAVQDGDGDYESIKIVETEDAKSLRFRYSSEGALINDDDLPEADQYIQYRPHPTDSGKVIRLLTVHRTVLRSDLQSADHFLRVFAPPPAVAETVPGTTAVGTSRRVFTALKAGKAVDFTTYLTAFDAAPLTSADSTAGSVVDPRFRGTLQRVEKDNVAVPVIVNGVLYDLPAVHVRGTLLDTEADFWFLDDPDNPLALRYTFGKERLDVIRINLPGASPGMAGPDDSSGIEQSLTRTGRADVYGIYFAFDSDLIRAESEPVLKEIAALLLRHPDWKLAVDGHTDNVGGAVANQALSERRAAAVKKALTQRYRIAPARLDTAGYGLSHPKATNATLQGRALNRRVELVREQQ